MLRTLLKSLAKPEAYPGCVTTVTLVQTHVSWIFLTDTHAYKIKKPVDFGFLNFSTIDRRRFYCHEEVRLNRRLCPDIYEGVVELREAPGGAAFYGDGRVIDYAVKMKRLPADRMLSQLVERGEATAEQMASVAKTIARFHRTAGTSPAIAAYGRLKRIMFNWAENITQSIPFERQTLPAETRNRIMGWVTSFAESHAETFEQRITGGFIRECDGDIHLDNICLVDDTVYIFDCIEFNERFRCCDTAADVAFLLMDLDYHRRHDLAEAALGAYLDESGDTGLAELLDFYRLYRAFVRGKVESLRLSDPELGHEEREAAQARAIGYFRLARGYVERHCLTKTLFLTCGLMGSGKSSLTATLACELGLASFNSDVVRKQMAPHLPENYRHDPYESGIYAPSATRATYDELLRLAEQELAAGRSVIVDACAIRRDRRTPFAELARRTGARFVILHLDCSDAELRRRLTIRAASPAAISDGRVELLDRQRAEMEPPEAREGLLVTLAADAPPSLLADEIYRRLASC
jgi:aminoglycoside phosphotransferase family enzyme/predicted kinase